MHNMGAMAKIKRVTIFSNKRSGTQFYHDWKPMQSIIDILHKNFQEEHTNSRRFSGGFLNSRRFPGVVDTLHSLTLHKHFPAPHISACQQWDERFLS